MNNDRLVYVPNRRDGKCLFNGEARPTELVLDLIGKKGVQEIRKKLAEIIDFRKSYRGRLFLDHYALYYFQNFFDLQKQILIKVEQTIDNESHKSKEPYSISLNSFYPPPYASWKRRTDRALRGQINRAEMFSDDDDIWHPSKESNHSLGRDKLHADLEEHLRKM